MTEINKEMLKALKEFTRAMNVLAMRPNMEVVEIAELLNPVGDIAREAINKATGATR
tara:strand:- start:347 stop:517 length:171 start_codon:yes stop_codon:yes gene_type:complete